MAESSPAELSVEAEIHEEPETTPTGEAAHSDSDADTTPSDGESPFGNEYDAMFAQGLESPRQTQGARSRASDEPAQILTPADGADGADAAPDASAGAPAADINPSSQTVVSVPTSTSSLDGPSVDDAAPSRPQPRQRELDDAFSSELDSVTARALLSPSLSSGYAAPSLQAALGQHPRRAAPVGPTRCAPHPFPAALPCPQSRLALFPLALYQP